jgi:hypothetical protein
MATHLPGDVDGIPNFDAGDRGFLKPQNLLG